ncbi:MAG: glycosyltransferase [Candidatus Omnitrophica bacterium]|nr:glycosyltransferase [Candidatus Omnitrophota bacterium]
MRSHRSQSSFALPPKDSLLFVVALSLWLFALLFFNPRLLILTIGPEPLPAKICVMLFVICLDIFWFYAIFHMTILTFSYFSRKPNDLTEKVPICDGISKSCPRVALLYVTYNDFQEEAALTCVKQRYEHCHLFILDDSTEEAYRARINAFAQTHRGRVTVIRRKERAFYKAGNLNHALSLIAVDYEFFSVSDADSRIPPEFIIKLLPYFVVPDIGFVQAMNIVNPQQPSYLAQAMGFNLQLHYRRYVVPRERYGFVMFHGHGALLRTDVWRKTGGFPEIVSEDLGFSTRMRVMGYYGVLAADCICYEDYPPTYRHYRRRTEKWIKGTMEFLSREFFALLRAKNVFWFEKIDVFVSGISLALGFPFLLFLLMGSIALPLYFMSFRASGPVFIPAIPEGKTVVSLVTGLRYNTYWTLDYYLIMLLTIFYPLVPVLIDLVRRPVKMLRYMSISTYLFLSTLVWVSYQSIFFLWKRKADFLVTAHEGREKQSGAAATSFFLARRHRVVAAAEYAFGALFALLTAGTNNLWLVSVAAALISSPLLVQYGMESRPLRLLLHVPFIGSVAVLFFIGHSLR